MGKTSNEKVVGECTQRIAALGRHVTAADTLLLDGVEHHVGDVVTIYQNSVDARGSVAAARTTEKAALVTQKRADTERATIDKALRGWVLSRFGAGSQVAIDFGFVPTVRHPPTGATRARAAALAKATRKARNTMGSRQRAHIKGTLGADAVSTATASGANGATAPGSTGNNGSNGSNGSSSGGGAPPR